MLPYAIVLLVVSLVVALFGFGGIALGVAAVAKLLAVVFVVLVIAGFVFGMIRKG